MTNTKKKMGYGLLVLALAAIVGMSFVVPASAAVGDRLTPEAGVEYETILLPVDEGMLEFVEKQENLTEAEKQLLVDESAAAQPIIDRISQLEYRIDTITNQILLGAEDLFEERGDIFDTYEDLWEKLWSDLNAVQLKLDDYSAIIEASDVLTDSEKETLLKAQARLDELEAGIDTYYAQAAEATKELTAQRDQAFAELEALYAKTNHIWDQIYGQ